VLGRLQSALERPASARSAYLTAALLGLVVYLAVFGLGHAVGTSSYWDLPLTDHRAYMMGYRYFLHEPWHWPVFVVKTMNLPFTKSIAFSDAIPAWAFVNKVIATIVPPWGALTERAYLGLWYLLLYVLQPLLAVANLRALRQRSWAATIATSLLFVAAPAWTNRYVHASMSAHFLTLWALYLYLRTEPNAPAPRRLRVVQLVQLATATLVNPYHAVMSFGLYCASVLRSRRPAQLAVWIPAGFAVIAIGAWFASYFTKEASLQMYGFEVASTNVLSFVMPYRSAFFGDALNADPTGFQYEGVAFAGLGIVVLLALFLPRASRLGAVISRHRYLFVVALGAWLFALSTHVWIGTFQLVAFTLPSKLGWFADQFRSPGRFVWIPMYVAMVFLAKEGLARFASGWRIWIVPVLAVLQLADATGGWSLYRDNTRGPDNPRIDLAGWRTLVHAHERVLVNPSYDCVLDGTADMDYVSLDIEYLASEHATPINGVYTARPTRNCVYDKLLLARSEPEPNTLYVFLRAVQDEAFRFRALGATCGEFKYGRACSLDEAAIKHAINAGILTPLATNHEAPDLAIGSMLELTPAANPAHFMFGWSWPDEHARFTDGPLARFTFHLTGTIPPSSTLAITLSPVLCGGRQRQVVEVVMNGKVLGEVTFPDDATRTLRFSVPASLVQRSVSYLDLKTRDSRRLDLIGCNADPRGIGLLVQRIGFQ